MIRLSVEPYCNDCPMFDPVSKRGVDLQLFAGGKLVETQNDDMVVFCKNNRQCSEIYKYLKKEVLNNGN